MTSVEQDAAGKVEPAMRISRDQVIGGLPAAQARELVRLYTNEEYPSMGAYRLEIDESEILTSLRLLTAEGYLEARKDHTGKDMFATTIKGNALSQASFARPIRRATADRQLSEVVQRAKKYNADVSKLLVVYELYVFGSYLDPTAEELGDVDLAIKIMRRYSADRHNELRQKQATAEGRTFRSLIDELSWPQRELILTLKARTSTISITGEEISRLTDRNQLVYSLVDDPDAIPVTADARIIEL